MEPTEYDEETSSRRTDFTNPIEYNCFECGRDVTGVDDHEDDCPMADAVATALDELGPLEEEFAT